MPKTVTIDEQMLKGLNNLNLTGEKSAWMSKFFNLKKPGLQEQAELYLQQRNWDKAIEAWKALLRKDPTNKSILITLAEIHLKKGIKGTAFTLFEKVVQLHLDEGQVDAAATLLKRVGELVGDDKRPYERLIRLLMKASEDAKDTPAERRYRDAALVELRRMAGNKQLCGNPENTLKYLRAISNLDPRDLGTAKRTVAILRELKREGEAMSFLRSLARKLLDRRLTDAAEKIIFEAFKLDNGNPGMKALFYLTQIQDGFGNQALQGLERLHQQHPHNVEVVLVLAEAETKLHRPEVAAKWLTAAFRIDSTQTLPLMDMGRSMLEDGKVGVAYTVFQALAEHAWSIGKPEIGINLLEPIFRQEPNHLPTLRSMALYCLRAKRPQDAMFFLDKAFTQYSQQRRLPDFHVFLLQCLTEFPADKGLRERMRKLDQSLKVA